MRWVASRYPYTFAAKFCRTFDINPAWLAENKEPIKGGESVNPSLEVEIRPRRLFSSIYNDIIKPRLAEKNEPSHLQNAVQKLKPRLAVHGLTVEIRRSVGAIDAATVQKMLSQTFFSFGE